MRDLVVFVLGELRLPVTDMFDIDRQETDDPDLACVVVGQLPDGRWYTTEVRPGDLRRGALS